MRKVCRRCRSAHRLGLDHHRQHRRRRLQQHSQDRLDHHRQSPRSTRTTPATPTAAGCARPARRSSWPTGTARGATATGARVSPGVFRVCDLCVFMLKACFFFTFWVTFCLGHVAGCVRVSFLDVVFELILLMFEIFSPIACRSVMCFFGFGWMCKLLCMMNSFSTFGISGFNFYFVL